MSFIFYRNLEVGHYLLWISVKRCVIESFNLTLTLTIAKLEHNDKNPTHEEECLGNPHDLSQMAVVKPRISKTNAKKQN